MARRKTHAEAETTMLAAGLLPLVEYPGSKVKWRCRCMVRDAVVEPLLNTVDQNGRGCKPCGIRRRAESKRIPEAQVVQQMRQAGMAPQQPYPGAMKPWLGTCLACGETISPSLHNVRGGQGACRFCAGQAVNPDRAADRMRDAGAEPLEPFPGSNQPWSCQCLMR